jgi:protein-S-isoprenylcysteine O-methyltransferase Ste14
MLQFFAEKRVFFNRILGLFLIALIYFSPTINLNSINMENYNTSLWNISGMILMVLGSIGRIWASLFIEGHKTKKVITEGPYSFIRHPLYLFSLMILLSLFLAIKSVFIGLYLLTMFILFHIPTVLNEERVLTELHGGDYMQYKNRVSRFIPNIFIYKKVEKDTYLDIRLQRVQQVMIEAVLLIILYEAIIFLN